MYTRALRTDPFAASLMEDVLSRSDSTPQEAVSTISATNREHDGQ